ncbi:putative RNA-dependent RNA polymerase 2 [Psilocybe cubensis]|uniref:RNA-dependent RNA polymerase 2 n=2 Tax=Psilocybe cubensis TaxID=181762 RepID=A0ACB8H8S4_PSICU|nr:putative RNA-dependent RNA polymerase 2 [Psilocybe cubensis]KAH9484125.1 putative RNA-dependent RNA polymerase 2 [Psilocybe cubensis]
MDLNIRYVPHEVNEWTVTRAVAAVLHSEDFAPIIEGRLINFRVKLNENVASGIRNDGTGVLTLPTEEIGSKFLRYVYDDPIKIGKQKLKFFKSPKPPPEHLSVTLRKTPYVNPDIEEERQAKVWALDTKLRVDKIQFGIFYQSVYPAGQKVKPGPRSFSVEWERDYTRNSYACLHFEYDHKLIRITLGNQLTEQFGCSIAVHFSSIQKVGVGYDGNPYICFDTLTPPVLESVQFHRTMTGEYQRDNQKYKQRIGAIDDAHINVAPYAPQLRIVLYNHPDKDLVKEFTNMCEIAGLSKSVVLRLVGPNQQIEANKKNFFSIKRMLKLHKTLGNFEWPVAFQLEALLYNNLMHTDDLDSLILQIPSLIATHGAPFVGDLLRRYHDEMKDRPRTESPSDCFKRTMTRTKINFNVPRDSFRCHHVTFTPTRMILEGPYPSQSNRVIRQYQGFEDHFLRVDFRDEDRLQYRWAREVNGASFLISRVGGILKQGFELAGRRFEFLAYSSSALREHAVWFMNPFYHPQRGMVDAHFIRESLGNFAGTELFKQPSKYAARLAQAFTATDPSVDILRHEWDEMPDIGEKPYLFTDGVGTISRALGDRIWSKLRENKHSTGSTLKPSAYQIRFLGYKGVVAIDEELDKNESSIHMRLRPSMRKFEVTDNQVAPLEIAQAFELPNTCYLNRPLVMVLEDLGVRKEALQDLQDDAVREARTIDDSIGHFRDVLKAHHLGSAFRLREILTRLKDKYNMDLRSDGKTIAMDDPFLRQLRQVAMNDILRDIKHSARIPVPQSYLLVGVADEGPAYEAEGRENVYCLAEGEIYACIQTRTEEPIWLTGNVSISRSPVAHPGDIRRVRAIGKPPPNCFFGHLKNVVVMPSKGSRSLASCLAGGDVDGDLYSIICYDPVLPRTLEEPASYEALKPYTLPENRDVHVSDICDFIVEYINSDLLGLLSDRLLVIADQSIDGIRDPNCIYLAELCSHAVDYPKSGSPPDLDTNELPRTLIRCKPDWHAAEVVSPRPTDYYESSRALGYMYRSITLDELQPIVPTGPPMKAFTDPISLALLDSVRHYLGDSAFISDNPPSEIVKLFGRYADELKYISATHTLSNTPGAQLLEAEVVIGTILAKCSQKRWRKDRIYRMRLHAEHLVRDVQRSLSEAAIKRDSDYTYTDLITGLELSWFAWGYSRRCRYNEPGSNSFGLIALGIIFDCLDKLDELEVKGRHGSLS